MLQGSQSQLLPARRPATQQPEAPADTISSLAEIRILHEHAIEHVEEWTAKEQLVATRQPETDGQDAAGSGSDGADVPSLFDLCTQHILEHARDGALTWMIGGRTCRQPLTWLPTFVLDGLFATVGRGREVAKGFIAEIALQSAVDEDGAAGADQGKASLSTIHRAKGLEWREVYSPWFNQGLMPSKFQEERDGNKAQRHVRGCAAFGQDGTGACNKDCARHFREGDASQRGTPEERHDDEERRLAHVAATRAKDRLVFVQVEKQLRSTPQGKRFMAAAEPSEYEMLLQKLPADVFVTIQKEL